MKSLRGQSLATAESCTGGLLAKRITDQPGSSEVFGYGLITYANEAKTRLLAPEELLERHGAVSPEVARSMAAGVRERYGGRLRPWHYRWLARRRHREQACGSGICGAEP